MKTNCISLLRGLAWAALTSVSQFSSAQDGQPTDSRPVVSMELVDPNAAETLIDQNAIFWAEFRVRRTGDLTKELVVYLNTQQGSAKLDEDYRLDRVDNGSTVRFAAGAPSVSVRLYPIDDEIYEGDETAFFHLMAPPAGIPLPGPYDIDFAHSSVSMIIHDNDPVTTRLEITAPHQDQHFEAGDVIELRSQIIGPGGGELWIVEFLDGDRRIGTTQPGGSIWWSDATGGSHTINARASKPNADPATGGSLVAGPVTISVGPGPALPVVSIGVQGRGKTMEPCPACFAPAAVFIISRTGPATDALVVHLEYDGPATPGLDYKELPHQVTIPAGQKSADLLLQALDDQLVEGPEIARATIVSPELATLGYVVSRYAAQAMVVIDDDEAGSPDIRLDIAEPKEGARFAWGSAIKVSALAVWREGEVDQPVKFFAGDTFIGQTNPPQLGRPTIPCLPSVHTISWISPTPGEYVLTARFERSPDLTAISPPVRIFVAVVDPPPWPVVSIETSPKENPQAPEFCPPNADCAYPSFIVRRTGVTDEKLRVWLRYSGTATPDADYGALPPFIDIPAGKDNAALMAMPKDDLLVEGPETIVARLSEPPTSPDARPYVIDPAGESATVTIVDNDHPVFGTVRIEVEDEIATEISILAAIDPARFRITRFGDLTQELTVFYSAHGSATPGKDYADLPATIQIPAGASSATLNVFPTYDQVAEGMETVLIRLEPSPLAGPMPTYEIDPATDDAVAVIIDGPGPPEPAVEIITPEEGEHFTRPAHIEMIAAAYHQTRDILGVDFYSGQTKIGESVLIFDRPGSGGLIVHRFLWNEPSQGTHVLTARGYDEDHALVATSPAKRITVDSSATSPVVRIDATSRIAEEDSIPFRRLPMRGEFTISRTGPTTDPLTMFVHFSGTATPGVDYPFLPWIVSIPAGAASTKIAVIPNDDDIPEGIEMVEAKLSQCPPDTIPPLGMPCFGGFEIDPAGGHATVFVRDDGITTASLAITNPKDGTNFTSGNTIRIDAVAIDLDGYISRIEFRDGGTKIGESEIVFIQAPPPGTPIFHSFEWHNAAPGPHTLTAQTIDPNGTVLASQPVRITVGLVADPMVLEVFATDAIASETGENGASDPAVFTIRRIAGPQNLAVPVYYSMAGTAQNGVDYAKLNGSVLLPAGAESVRVDIGPLSDSPRESDETVILRLEPPVCIAIFPPPPECYAVGPHGSAQAVIRDGAPNSPPQGTITSPASGAEFPAGAPIEIVVDTRDPDGYVRKVEFFADGRKIGEASMDFTREPDQGEAQTFTFVWRQPTPGAHTLTARSTDNHGAAADSAPVEIKVGMSELLPIVTVDSPDPIAVEPGADGTTNTATFRIRRFGSTAGDLLVAYSLEGTAENGVDCEMLPGVATIPSGQHAVNVIVRPSADSLNEREETVILFLDPPPPASPGVPAINPYSIGIPGVAVAVIKDSLSPASPAGAQCVPLAGNLMEVCFPAEAGHNYRIEATSDLRNWETVFDAVSSDGMLHFIDADMPNHRQRFYRLTPEPVALVQE